MSNIKKLRKEIEQQALEFESLSKGFLAESKKMEAKEDIDRCKDLSKMYHELAVNTYSRLVEIETTKKKSILDIFNAVANVGSKFSALALNKYEFETLKKIELNNGLPQKKSMEELQKNTLKSFM